MTESLRRRALARAWLLGGVVAAMLVGACGDDGPDVAVSTVGPSAAPATSGHAVAPPTAASGPVATTVRGSAPTERPASTTTEPRPVVPPGVLAAVITQNRTDVVENRFQVQLVNGTRDRYDITSVQLVWAGFTPDPVVRDPPTVIVGGQRLDIRTPFPGATCVGDGTRATMPSLDDAYVAIELVDGSRMELPVVDELFIGRRLYEEDCQRQAIAEMVAIEWVGLREEQFEGRPVTAAELRVSRLAGEGEFRILEVGNTIPYTVDAFEAGPGTPVVTLAADADVAEAPVRFLERRCDPHALQEVKQPTNFAAQVELPDGSVHAYIVYPPREYWLTMRRTADAACAELGLIVPLVD